MKNAEDLRRASAGEIADDTLRLLQAVMKDQPSVEGIHWMESKLTIRDRLDELVRRAESASAPQPHLKEKKQPYEVPVNFSKTERMSLAVTAPVKERYQNFLRDKKNAYAYTSAALDLFMKLYKERAVRLYLEG